MSLLGGLFEGEQLLASESLVVQLQKRLGSHERMTSAAAGHRVELVFAPVQWSVRLGTQGQLVVTVKQAVSHLASPQ